MCLFHATNPDLTFVFWWSSAMAVSPFKVWTEMCSCQRCMTAKEPSHGWFASSGNGCVFVFLFFCGTFSMVGAFGCHVTGRIFADWKVTSSTPAFAHIPYSQPTLGSQWAQWLQIRSLHFGSLFSFQQRKSVHTVWEHSLSSHLLGLWLLTCVTTENLCRNSTTIHQNNPFASTQGLLPLATSAAVSQSSFLKDPPKGWVIAVCVCM